MVPFFLERSKILDNFNQYLLNAYYVYMFTDYNLVTSLDN